MNVITAAATGREIVRVVLDDSRAYFATCSDTECEDISVLSIAKDGSGPTTTYTTDEPCFDSYALLAVDETHVYWGTFTSGGTASNPQQATAQIRAAPKDGSGAPVTVFQGDAGSVSDFVADATRIYWTSPLTSSVMQMGTQ